MSAIVLLVLLVLAAGIASYRRPARRGARTLYLDVDGASRVFESRRYGIRAKPDKLERCRDGGVELVELKSRPRRRPYPSDVAQVIAATLAVREAGLDVRAARLETPVGSHAIDLDASDDALFRRIRPAVGIARQVAAGVEPRATPAVAKCGGCGYRDLCPHAVPARR